VEESDGSLQALDVVVLVVILMVVVFVAVVILVVILMAVVLVVVLVVVVVFVVFVAVVVIDAFGEEGRINRLPGCRQERSWIDRLFTCPGARFTDRNSCLCIDKVPTLLSPRVPS
jgi:hypothetical protein